MSPGEVKAVQTRRPLPAVGQERSRTELMGFAQRKNHPRRSKRGWSHQLIRIRRRSPAKRRGRRSSRPRASDSSRRR